MNMGNTKINKVKQMQQLNLQKKIHRQTGIKVNTNPSLSNTKTISQINYVTCRNCGQQILSSTYTSHLMLCKANLQIKTSGCSACNKSKKF